MDGVSGPDAAAGDAPYPWQLERWRRLARTRESGRLAHGYLVTGPEGIGKSGFVARFARMMLCESPRDDLPCGECVQCALGRHHPHPDMLPVRRKMNAQGRPARDIAVDQIRAVAEFVSRTSHGGRAKIVVIDGAHRMNVSASNALLKTLEEPTDRTHLFLITDSPGSLPPTVASRCQRLAFGTPDLEAGAEWLRDRIEDGQDAAGLLAAANGRPLRALRMATDGSAARRRELIEGLAGILGSRGAGVRPVVDAAMQGEADFALDCLLTASAALARRQLAGRAGGGGDPAAAALADRLPAADPALGKRALLFHEGALKARRQLAGAGNPNVQLMLEALLWRWSHLGRRPGAPGGGTG